MQNGISLDEVTKGRLCGDYLLDWPGEIGKINERVLGLRGDLSLVLFWWEEQGVVTLLKNRLGWLFGAGPKRSRRCRAIGEDEILILLRPGHATTRKTVLLVAMMGGVRRGGERHEQSDDKQEDEKRSVLLSPSSSWFGAKRAKGHESD